MTKKKNVMMSEEVHLALLEIRMKIYRTKGTLLSMEKTIMYLLENQVQI